MRRFLITMLFVGFLLGSAIFTTRFGDASDTKPKTYTDPKTGIEFVRIPGGSFKIGSDDYEVEKNGPTVTLKEFYLGKTEVTNAQFIQFLNAKGNQTEDGVEWIMLSGSWKGEKSRIYKNGSTFQVQSGYENYPVIYVSWYGARAFCDWIGGRLPSEVEWEYAARCGSKQYKYSWGNGAPTGKKGGNVADETAKKVFADLTVFEGYTDGFVYTASVGSFDANEFGLYDMTGNVWEWCAGHWHDRYTDLKADGTWNSVENTNSRVVRGGSFYGGPFYARATNRPRLSPGVRDYVLGFRVVRGF